MIAPDIPSRIESSFAVTGTVAPNEPAINTQIKRGSALVEEQAQLADRLAAVVNRAEGNAGAEVGPPAAERPPYIGLCGLFAEINDNHSILNDRFSSLIARLENLI